MGVLWCRPMGIRSLRKRRTTLPVGGFLLSKVSGSVLNGFSGIGRGAFHCDGRLPAKAGPAPGALFLPPLPECPASVLESSLDHGKCPREAGSQTPPPHEGSPDMSMPGCLSLSTLNRQ